MKRTVGLLLLLGVALLVFFITREVYKPAPPTEEVTSNVLLERIRPVMKLVTVEGDFVETYTHKDTDAAWFPFTKGIPWNERHVILIATARVSVGYDLEGLGLKFNEQDRTVRFVGLDEPEILSIEEEIRYFDIEQGAFKPFTAQEHTKFQAQAKEAIRSKVAQSGLFQAAEKQKGEFLLVLRAVVENGGWTFEEGSTAVKRPMPQ